MTPQEFCYWLRGFFELAKMSKDAYNLSFTPAQIDAIDKHLASVFTEKIMQPQPLLAPQPWPYMGGGGTGPSHFPPGSGGGVIC